MYTGLTGALKTLTGLTGRYESVAFISGWNLEQSTEVIEISKVGKVDKEAYTGKQSWSASASGTIVFSGENSGHEQLFRAQQLGQRVRLQLHLFDSIRNGQDSTYFLGNGFIESLSVDMSAEGVAKIDISIKGTGKLETIIDGENLGDRPIERAPIVIIEAEKSENSLPNRSIWQLRAMPDDNSPIEAIRFEEAISDDGETRFNIFRADEFLVTLIFKDYEGFLYHQVPLGSPYRFDIQESTNQNGKTIISVYIKR
ncbi:MAG: phage tail tube protein [Firmicutes bacterium]|nr:phage tail tube protein [Bacillota bacterium]